MSMTSPHCAFRFVCGLVLAASPVLVPAVETIITPTKRADSLELARQLLATKRPPVLASNPFYSETFNETLLSNSGGVKTEAAGPAAAPVAPVGPKSARDLLEAIATSIKPSGYFVIGGEPTLVFGQKRVKAGGLLTITFEGKEYTLEVSAVDRTNFTLRLNREEFTRPIK